MSSRCRERRLGASHDFTDLHAWCEVYLPGAGWVGLDPTSGLVAGEGHIPLACTPEPSTAAPISGGVEPSGVDFAYEMTVQRIVESPRVTKPFTDEEWEKILACGSAVDAELAAGDVRLTMGGEPTFVSVSDCEADEWNTAALGPTKRARATTLLALMKERYGARGFVHFGQGKWYPGEPLPRWSLGCYWRADGEPAWTDATLVADELHPDGDGAPEAERFVTALAAQLGVTGSHALAAYEEVWYYLWRERQLPVNVDPLDARLDDELERDRLRQVFTQGLAAVVGYALPLRWVGERDGHWSTGRWFLRSERLYLLPGDSPMGFRLPLDSLPWASPEIAPRSTSSIPLRRATGSQPPGGETIPARSGPRRSFPACSIRQHNLAIHSLSRTAPAPDRLEANRPPASSVPRCASSLAAESCTSSCRRCRRSRSTWIWLPPLKPRPRPSACACCSRAIGRQTIPGCQPFSSLRIRE